MLTHSFLFLVSSFVAVPFLSTPVPLQGWWRNTADASSTFALAPIRFHYPLQMWSWGHWASPRSVVECLLIDMSHYPALSWGWVTQEEVVSHVVHHLESIPHTLRPVLPKRSYWCCSACVSPKAPGRQPWRLLASGICWSRSFSTAWLPPGVLCWTPVPAAGA